MQKEEGELGPDEAGDEFEKAKKKRTGKVFRRKLLRSLSSAPMPPATKGSGEGQDR